MPAKQLPGRFCCLIIVRMSAIAAPPAQALRQLASAAFAVQASVCLVAWFVVNDRSRGRGVWVTSDFEEWATLSALCAAMLVVFSGWALRSWLKTSAVAAGSLVAAMSGVAIFVAWAVFNSA